MKFLTAINLDKNEITNVRLQNLATAPGSPGDGQIYFDTTDDVAKIWSVDAARWLEITDAWVSGVNPTAPIQATISGSAPDRILNISIPAATSTDPGHMTAADKAKLDNATQLNSASTLVFRDASGNFSAGTITATLIGNASTASDAELLDGQDGTWYQNRANHTGSQAASTISDLATVVKAYRLDEFASPTANVSFNAQKIVNLADPTNPQDAATKAYVDAARAGLNVKNAARVGTTANVDLTTGGLLTIDGVALADGNRVLVKEQTNAAQNGIYVASSGAWSRAADADSDAEVTSGMFVFVSEGNTLADTGWVLTTDDPITLGTTSLNFAQFSGAGSIEAGAGLSQSGNTLNVGAGTGITVNADTVQISTSYAGQTSITTVGTITNGTWQGSAVGVAYGGTGATTASGARLNLGATGKFAADIGDGAATSYTLNHNFNTQDVTVLLRETASPYAQVYADVEMGSVNSVTIRFSTAPTTNQYRAIVVG